jgi:hypothetical protein
MFLPCKNKNAQLNSADILPEVFPPCNATADYGYKYVLILLSFKALL